MNTPLLKLASTTVGGLKRHKKYKHEGLGHHCDQCEHTAISAGHLKKHVKKNMNECNITMILLILLPRVV